MIACILSAYRTNWLIAYNLKKNDNPKLLALRVLLAAFEDGLDDERFLRHCGIDN